MDSLDPSSLRCGFARKGEMFRVTCPETEEDMQELMTREIAEGLPRLYEQDGAEDPTVYVHYFSCVNGWDWWLLEFDGTDEAFGLVGLLDPVGQAARVAAQPSRHLGVRRARFPVQLHGLLLEFRRVPGRWPPHRAPFPRFRTSCRNGNPLVNGSGADSDSDSMRRSGHGPRCARDGTPGRSPRRSTSTGSAGSAEGRFWRLRGHSLLNRNNTVH